MEPINPGLEQHSSHAIGMGYTSSLFTRDGNEKVWIVISMPFNIPPDMMSEEVEDLITSLYQKFRDFFDSNEEHEEHAEQWIIYRGWENGKGKYLLHKEIISGLFPQRKSYGSPEEINKLLKERGLFGRAE